MNVSEIDPIAQRIHILTGLRPYIPELWTWQQQDRQYQGIDIAPRPQNYSSRASGTTNWKWDGVQS